MQAHDISDADRLASWVRRCYKAAWARLRASIACREADRDLSDRLLAQAWDDVLEAVRLGS